MKAAASLEGLSLASPRPSQAAKVSLPSRLKYVQVNLKILVTSDEHRQVKLRCAERGLTVADYLRGLLEADGIQMDPRTP